MKFIEKTHILAGTIDNYTSFIGIGNGGNSNVYSAKRMSDGCVVAVKILNGNQTTNDIIRFKNELDFQKHSSCKFIVKVIDEGIYISKDGKKLYFYVMPLYKSNFKNKLMDEDISYEKKLKYFLNICNALKYIHSRGVYHRDVKPENLLYDEEKDILLLADFGIAHFNHSELTKNNVDRLGNFTYHAPEQNPKSSIKVGSYTDIYAMGLILNQIFTNQVPIGINYFKIIDYSPIYASLDDIIDKMLLFDIDYRKENVINSINYLLNKTKEELKSYYEEIDLDVKKKIGVSLTKQYCRDICLLNYLLRSKVYDKNVINYNYHCSYKYVINSVLVASLLLIDIYKRIKEKFRYEAQATEVGNILKNIRIQDAFDDKLYKKFCDILNQLQNFKYINKYKGESIKYFCSLTSYHCREILEEIQVRILPRREEYSIMTFYEIYEHFRELQNYLNEELYVECYVKPDTNKYFYHCNQKSLFVDKSTTDRIIEIIEKKYKTITILKEVDDFIVIFGTKREKM